MSVFVGTPRIPAAAPAGAVGTPTQVRVVRMACSVLLEYPEAPLLEPDGPVAGTRAALEEMPEGAAREIARFCDAAEEWGLRRLQEHYVETFDQRRRCALSLTYYSHGDTRLRGQAILAIREVLRRAGFEVAREELPDHLPVVLEFCALDTTGAAEDLLRANREGVEVIRTALRSADSPYARLLDALAETLPAPDARTLEAYRRLVSQGPPSEMVGINALPLADALPLDQGGPPPALRPPDGRPGPAAPGPAPEGPTSPAGALVDGPETAAGPAGMPEPSPAGALVDSFPSPTPRGHDHVRR